MGRYGVVDSRGAVAGFGEDLAAALRYERAMRAKGWDVQAVVQMVDGGFALVGWDSRLRSDPRPPVGPRRVAAGDSLGRVVPWWARAVARWGRNRGPFGRRDA